MPGVDNEDSGVAVPAAVAVVPAPETGPGAVGAGLASTARADPATVVAGRAVTGTAATISSVAVGAVVGSATDTTVVSVGSTVIVSFAIAAAFAVAVAEGTGVDVASCTTIPGSAAEMAASPPPMSADRSSPRAKGSDMTKMPAATRTMHLSMASSCMRGPWAVQPIKVAQALMSPRHAQITLISIGGRPGARSWGEHAPRRDDPGCGPRSGELREPCGGAGRPPRAPRRGARSPPCP